MNVLCYSITSAASNGCSSLEGVEGYADGDIALVQQPNRYYRFYSASTATPDDESVVLPNNIQSTALPGRWIREGGPGPVGGTFFEPVATASCLFAGYEFRINSREDLVRAVGEPTLGVFTLTNGAYAQGESFALNSGESILVPSGGRVQWDAFGNATLTFSGAANTAWDVQGWLNTRNLQMLVNGDNAVGMNVNGLGRVTSLHMFIQMLSATGTTALILNNGSGRNSFEELEVASLNNGISLVGGITQMFGGRIEAVADSIFGGAADGLTAVGTTFVTIDGSALAAVLAAGEWVMDSCRFEKSGAADNLIEISGSGCTVLDLNNCKMVGAGNGPGIFVAGNIATALKAFVASFENLTNAIQYSSGTVDLCLVNGCDSTADVIGSFIVWTAANIPTDGLLVNNCRHAGAGAFNLSHTQFDALVNYKDNSHNGALIPETPIVGPPTFLEVTATGIQQDWVPGGDAAAWDRASHLFVQTGGGGDLTIGGLAPPLTPASPRQKTIIKASAADNVILSNNDGNSAATAQLRVIAAADTAADSNVGWIIFYINGLWRVLGTIGVL